MNKEILKGIKIGVGILIILASFFGLVYAVGFHSASEVISGEFNGNYSFNGSVGIGVEPTIPFEVACPSGFTSIKSVNTQLGCMQNTEEGTGSWENAIQDCFTTYGATLPTTGEWYLTMNNYELTDEIDDWEWNDDTAGNSGNLHSVSGSGSISTSSYGADTTTTYSYRCWIPR